MPRCWRGAPRRNPPRGPRPWKRFLLPWPMSPGASPSEAAPAPSLRDPALLQLRGPPKFQGTSKPPGPSMPRCRLLRRPHLKRHRFHSKRRRAQCAAGAPLVGGTNLPGDRSARPGPATGEPPPDLPGRGPARPGGRAALARGFGCSASRRVRRSDRVDHSGDAMGGTAHHLGPQAAVPPWSDGRGWATIRPQPDWQPGKIRS